MGLHGRTSTTTDGYRRNWRSSWREVGCSITMILLCIYNLKVTKRKVIFNTTKRQGEGETLPSTSINSTTTTTSSNSRWVLCSCIGKILRSSSHDQDTSETEASSDSCSSTDGQEEEQSMVLNDQKQQLILQQQQKVGTLVTVDEETVLELETLLKASAYILETTGSSIVYKVVLDDGRALAVRRIGETIGIERFRDFENQVRAIAKLRHPNLVQVRAFYWGSDEKLIIYDHVSNGNLANASNHNRMARTSTPCHLPWEDRLKIARGVARGLAYLHEKKHVHGNLKPTNILLDQDMNPKISDFGLKKLVRGDTSSRVGGSARFFGDTSYRVGGSARFFGSKRSTISHDSLLRDVPIIGAIPNMMSSITGGPSPYQAPESLKNLKPSPKWDVYSFGIVLLKLLTGKIFSDVDELVAEWNSNAGFELGPVDEKTRALRMADSAIRPDVERMEDALLACFRLGFSCTSVVQTKRPSMKEVLQVLERIPSSPCCE